MRLLPPLLLAFVAGCATIVGTLQLDDRFGPADPARFDHPPAVLADAPLAPTQTRVFAAFDPGAAPPEGPEWPPWRVGRSARGRSSRCSRWAP